MSRFRPYAMAFVSGITGVVVGSVMLGGVVYAANGGSLIIGRSNSGTATTTLTNTAGTAMSFVSKSGYAPIKVSNGTKVTYLNADRLDGLDSTLFARAAGKTGVAYSDVTNPVDVDDDGLADFYMASAVCPSGTILTGGGGGAYGAADLFFSGPQSAGEWAVASMDGDLEVFAVCLNLKGAAPTGLIPLSYSGNAEQAFAESFGTRALQKSTR